MIRVRRVWHLRVPNEKKEKVGKRLDRDNVVGSWLHVLECQGNEHRKIRIKELGQEGR